MFDGEGSDAGEGALVKDRAGGIVGRIENENAGLVRNFGSDLREVGLKIIFLDEREGHGCCSETAGERWIDGKPRIGIENLVAGFDERHHCEGESHFAARRDENLLRLNGKFSGAREIVRDFFAQGGNAASSTVAIAAGSDGVAKSIDDGRGGMKIGFTEFEVDDGAALALKFLGARKYSESALTIQMGNTGCDSPFGHGEKFSI